MLTKKIITCLILGISLNAGAYMGESKTYYNNAQIGKSYKSQLQQASIWKSRLTSMESNILARNRIDMETKKRIEDAKSQLSIFEESFKQLKNSGDYELGSMILKETAYSSDCKPKSISAPIPSVTVYECNSPTRMRETFFSKVKDGDYHVTSYKSGYLEDTLKDVELLIHELRRYDARAINVGRIVHRV